MQGLEGLEGERIRRLHIDEYLHLAEIGAFEDEKVELLDGVVVEMSPTSDPHTMVVALLMERLIRQIDDPHVIVIPQSSLRMGDYSMPEPDLAVLPRPTSKPPRLRGGLLVVEVAVSSLRKDLTKKPQIYAEAGVPEYWVIDVEAQTVVVHTNPLGRRYTTIEDLPRSGLLRPTKLPGIEILVDELFADL